MADDFEQERQHNDLQEHWELFRRRRWYFLAPLFLGWLLVWAAGWILPPIYRSGTLILVEQPTVPQQYVPSNVEGDIQAHLNSISQQILSRTRLLQILDKLSLYSEDKQRLMPEALVDRMRKDIEIEIVRSPGHADELTAFNIYYRARDPHTAQQVLEEITDLFITQNLLERQQQSENTTKFLESQLNDARANLAEQEQKVRQFKDRYLGELPGQLQANLQVMSSLQAQLQAETDALNRAKQQNTYFESVLQQYRTMEAAVHSAKEAPIGLPAIDQELDRLRAQLADLSSHYTDRHPDVRKLKDQISKTEKIREQVKAELAAQAGSAQGGGKAEDGAPAITTATEVKETPAMIEVDSQLRANQMEMNNRQHSIKEIEEEIRAYQARLNRAPMREQELADLTRDYDQSRAYYDSLLAKKNQSEMATNLEKRQQGEHFRILDPPSLPSKPYSPNRLLLSGIGLCVGIVFGFGTVKGAEKLDPRIYGEKEFQKLVPVPVLADIPVLSTEREDQKHRRRVQMELVLAVLIFMAVAAGTAISYLRG